MSARPRLLVVELHNLGDAVLSLPFLRGAVRRFEVYVVCRPAAVPVYQLARLDLKLIPWNPVWKEGLEGMVRLVTQPGEKWGPPELAAGFDYGVNIWPDPRASIFMRSFGVRKNIGFTMHPVNRYGWYRPPLPLWLGGGAFFYLLGGWKHGFPLLDVPLKKKRGESHLNMWGELANACGFDQDLSLPWISIPEEAVRGARKSLQDVGMGPVDPWILHPTARVSNKQWPAEGFREVAAYLKQKNIPVIAVVAESEWSDALESLSVPVLRCGSIEQLGAVLSLSRGVLAHDSLVSHLAAALGKRTVSLFGTCYVSEFAPFQNEEWVVWDGNTRERPNLTLESLPPAKVIARMENFTENI